LASPSHGAVPGADLFQHLIDGFHNRDLRALVIDLLGVTADEYTPVR
jgi:hypothetical protein